MTLYVVDLTVPKDTQQTSPKEETVKIEEEVERLRKSRFFSDFDRIRSSLSLGRRLAEGELSGGSDEIRGRGLAWCARVLSTSDDLERAEDFLKLAKTLGDSTEAKIAEAFVVSQKGGRSAALQVLAGIDSERAYNAKEIKALKETAERAPDAPPVIKKIHKKGATPDPLRGLFPVTIAGKPAVVEYEPDTELRDTEQVPLLEEGGIDAFLKREVLPYAPDAWYDPATVKIGYEISFTRYFYKPQPLRPLEEIRADILALKKETEGLLDDIIGGAH